MSSSISVVITTYERFGDRSKDNFLLEETLRSVLQQSVPPKEIIVSVDGTSEVARSIVDNVETNSVKSLQVVESGPKIGGSQARNQGIQRASGDYIALLDDDDIWYETKIEKQLELANQQLDNNFFIFTGIEMGEPGAWHSVNTPKFSGDVADYLFVRNGTITTSTLFAPKEVFVNIPFTANLKKHQDWDWELNASLNHDVKVMGILEPLVGYRSNGQASRKSVSKTVDWEFSYNWIDRYKLKISDESYFSFVKKHVITPIIVQNNLNRTQKIKSIYNLLKKIPMQYKIDKTVLLILPRTMKQIILGNF
ncbi:glycosyltransferase family 2 protein [Weissella confusa]|uniref:glycosyltransferase family 2 protein n=1 Tax=Weissella confusa TaxID=1583 RepID=UPI0021A93345|nr:glycosyltransferase family A protein [Weissella confusa]MCT2911656.1 glycosyltransferase family 2 protein [Weissella confusa]